MAPAADRPAGACWWQPRAVLRRFVADLVEDELVRQRHRPCPLPRPWPEELDLVADLGVDSLELMALATALAEALHLHESGVEDYLLARRTLRDWTDLAAAGLERFSDALTFRTSGSSGMPTSCPHALQLLLQETAEHARMFGGRRRILCAVPSHHIYGFLLSVLLPRALGLAADAVIDIRGRTPAWLASFTEPGDLVVGHPEFWNAVGRTVAKLPGDVVGVTSTAPCPDAVSEAVEATGARLFHLYGSSETAGIGWRAAWQDPYRLFAYFAFEPETPACLWRELPDGTRSQVRCQDRLERGGGNLFRVGPRNDAAVQVAGNNVFPSRVAEVLRRHPLVADAAVRLMRPDEGSRLKAFVVPAAGVRDRDAFLADVERWIERELAVPERPRALRLGARLPTAESGKASDWSLDAPI
jgi:4-coumarate--CoA ligase (photoactive yellow protein activation family)